MFINKIADTIVFKTLKSIKYGYLEVTNFEGEVLKFGNINKELRAKVIINHPSLNYSLIRNGSIGLAEGYMQGYFETESFKFN